MPRDIPDLTTPVPPPLPMPACLPLPPMTLPNPPHTPHLMLPFFLSFQWLICRWKQTQMSKGDLARRSGKQMLDLMDQLSKKGKLIPQWNAMTQKEEIIWFPKEKGDSNLNLKASLPPTWAQQLLPPLVLPPLPALMPSQLLLVSAPVTHSKKERWQKVVSYMGGSHCTHFRDDTPHPSGPSWPHDKGHQNLIVFDEVRCHFEFSKNFWKLKHMFEGQMILEGDERSTRLQCTSPMPWVDRKSEYNPFFHYLQGTRFFSKHSLPFLFWAPPPIHTGATPPCSH